MSLKEITDQTFDTEIFNSEKLAVLDFTATWCQPCKKIKKSLEELAPNYEGKVVFGEINVEVSPNTALKYGVISLPQVLFFRAGNHLDTIHGVLAKEKLAAKIDALLG
jgi:thioredoxin 1